MSSMIIKCCDQLHYCVVSSSWSQCDIGCITFQLHLNDEISIYSDHEVIVQDDHILIHNYDEAIYIFFPISKKGYNTFKKVEFYHDVRIGGKSDDIVIKEDTICIIHQTKHFIVVSDDWVYVNGKRFIEGMLQQGDVIVVESLVIVVHDDFLMINECHHTLAKKRTCKIVKNTDNVQQLIVQYRYCLAMPTIKIDAVTMPTIQQVQTTPLLLSIGPSLTMSLASLSTSLMNGYNQYQQGKEIIEMMPTLLLPIVMLTSLLLWSPLQRRSESKKIQLIQQTNQKNYEEQCRVVEEKIEQFHQQLHAYYDSCFITMEMAKNILNGKEEYRCQRHMADENASLIALGHGVIPSTIENKTLQSWVFIELKQHQHLCFLSMECFHYFYTQLLLYYGYDEFCFVWFVEPSFYKQFSTMMWVPHCLTSDKNNRYCITSVHQIKQVNPWLSLEKRRLIFFVQQPSLLSTMTIKPYCSLYLIDNHHRIPLCADVIIEEDKLMYRDGRIQLFQGERGKVSYRNMYFSAMLKKNEPKKLSLKTNFTCQWNKEWIKKLWHTNTTREGIKAILGVNDFNEPFILDLHEKGHGPHGIIAGATGSGKSHLLITLLLTLCIQYSPLDVQIVIIDFKGGGLSETLKGKNRMIDHIIGTITNLDQYEMQRALISFQNECYHRQRCFMLMQQKKGVANIDIDEYQQLQKEDSSFESLAHCIIVVDEFAELKKYEPEFMSDLISIARVGRSLGLHLVLSTQKPSGVVDSQLWSNSRFKCCLKVQDKQDSMEMIDKADAAMIKNPGEFYLLCDNHLQKGKVAYSLHLMDDSEENDVVMIKDSIGSTIHEEKKQKVQGKTQLQFLLQLLEECGDDLNINNRALWLPPLKRQLFDYKGKEICLGMIDDITTCSHKPLLLEKNSCIVYSLNQHETSKIVRIFLYEAMRLQHDILYFDGHNSSIHYEGIKRISPLESDELKRIMTSIKEDIVIGNHRFITLVIHHLPMFYDCYPDAREDLSYVLANNKNITIFITTSIASSIHYKDCMMIARKIVLQGISKSDMSQLFECSIKKMDIEEDFGIIKENRVLKFRMREISEDLFLKQLSMIKPSSYITLLTKEEYDGSDVVYGIRNNAFEVWSEKGIKVIFAKEYEEAKKYALLIKNKDCCCITSEVICDEMLQQPEKLVIIATNVTSVYWLLQRKIIQEKDCLWIKEGFRQQFALIGSNQECSDNEGLIDGRKVELFEF